MTTYAEDVNFWKTSRSSPDEWIGKTKRQIETLGGKIEAEGFGSDANGRAAFMLGFSIKGDTFKIIWPVLKSVRDEEKPARVQAATMLYHYVKSVCLYAIVVGAKNAFFGHLMLDDGRTASQVSNDELKAMSPAMFLLADGQ